MPSSFRKGQQEYPFCFLNVIKAFETKNLTWLKFGFLCNFKIKKTFIQNTELLSPDGTILH